MPELSKIRKNSVDYDIKDATARQEIEVLKQSGGSGVAASAVRAIPELRLVGDTTGISKDNKVYLSYTFRDTANGNQHTGWCDLKWQGETSLAYDKKNYKITLYKDPYYKNKDKVDLGFGKQSKYTLKGNMQDRTMVRNVVGCRIWGAVVNTRKNYLEALADTPNHGSTDGFPFNLYLNDEYVGLYTCNTDKSWMTGQDEDNPLHCLVDQDLQTNGFASGAFSSWAIEIPDAWTDELRTSFQNMLTFVSTSTDDEFVAGIDNYVDLESAIDYLCFIYLMGALDSNGKNQMMMTFDGVKWYMNVYDQDSNLGCGYGGEMTVSTEVAYPDGYQQKNNTLLSRIMGLLPDMVAERYNFLRETVLSVDYIKNEIKMFFEAIPTADVARNSTKWHNSATDGTSVINYYINWITDRAAYVDTQINGTQEGYVPCESITLSVESLKFDSFTSKTITATVLPENTSDKIIWKSSNDSVCTVDPNGVVTAVSSGEAIITAICGKYRAECSVEVSTAGIVWSTTAEYRANSNTGYIYSKKVDGENSMYDRYKSAPIVLKSGKSYRFDWTSAFTDAVVYDASGKVIFVESNSGRKEFTISIPEVIDDCTVVLLCGYVGFDASKTTVTEREDSVWSADTDKWCFVKATGEMVSKWWRYKNGGTSGEDDYWGDNTAWVTMHPVPVNAGQTLSISAAPNAVIQFYKADGTFISGTRNGKYTADTVFSETAPDETAYALCLVRKINISDTSGTIITVDGVEFTV